MPICVLEMIVNKLKVGSKLWGTIVPSLLNSNYSIKVDRFWREGIANLFWSDRIYYLFMYFVTNACGVTH